MSLTDMAYFESLERGEPTNYEEAIQRIRELEEQHKVDSEELTLLRPIHGIAQGMCAQMHYLLSHANLNDRDARNVAEDIELYSEREDAWQLWKANHK